MTTNTNGLHPLVQFLLFWIIFVIIMFVGTLIGVGVITAMYGSNVLNDIAKANFDSSQAHNAIWILQLSSMTLPLFITPVLFAYTIVHDADDYLKPHFEFKGILLLIILPMMLLSLPMIEYLSNVNHNIYFPPNLKWLKDWFQQSEESTEKMVEGMMQMHTIGNLIAVVLFVGLLTAIVEEFMFRGCLQTIMFRWTKNVHVAVWVTAILFSAFHMEFFGFIPRLLLGVIFGYLVVWSGSVWTSVWAHFINNATDVILTYLANHHYIGIKADDQHVFNNVAYIFSAIFTLTLLLTYAYIAKWRTKTVEH